jgi:hypothetical protein
VSLDATKLVIQNGCSSNSQVRWATLVLVLGFFCIYFTVSKVVGHLLYFWSIILFQVLIFMLTCWLLAPAVTTFDKIKGTVTLEKFNMFSTSISEYYLLDIETIQIKNPALINRVSTIYLGIRSGKYLYLSNFYDNKRNCRKILGIIKNFLDNNEY